MMTSLGYVVGTLWNHPSNRGRRVATLCTAVAWQVRKRLTRTPARMPIFRGLTLLCYPDQGGSSAMLYSNGWPDYDEMYFVARYLRPGDSMIDVGANIGIYTLLSGLTVGPKGYVLAFEPGPKAYSVLQENIKLNRLSHIEARCLAVGPVDGQIRFLQNQDLTNRIVVASETAGDDTSAMVGCTKLDTVINRPFAMGKIDIEGTEPLAFEGGVEALAAGNPPVWIMEFKDRLLRRFNWTADQFARVVHGHGYRLGLYDARRNELSFAPLRLDDLDNVIAVKESAVEMVQRRLATCDMFVPGAPRFGD